MVRPVLDYVDVIWNKDDIKLIRMAKKVQRRATKLIPEISNLTYGERLKSLKLTSLKYRRRRGDIIQLYRLIHGFSRSTITIPLFNNTSNAVTRGHSLKLEKQRNLIKQTTIFHRTIDDWNGLNEEIVNAKSVSEFKIKLDNFWDNHPEKYMDVFDHAKWMWPM